ncbi:MAG TPA: glycosyltransferase [Persephonella sp.]|nr:glycosyltransferase [Persephonella sp.]
MAKLTVSIVLYNNQKRQIERVIKSVLSSNIKSKLILIDNSSTDNLRSFLRLKGLEYIFNNKNMGFGRAHNIAMRKSIEERASYHLVLNPDVYFEQGVLEELYNFMEKNQGVGLVMPKVLFPDGNIQYLCRLLPTPFDLFGRRFLNFSLFERIINRRNEIYELRFTGYDNIMIVPNLSGCFMFLRTSVLQKVGLFDERFFMYMEDTDLSRRVYRVAETIYYPYVSIYHEYGRGSYKDKRLLKYHIKSAIKYFNKWGWFLDKERERINKEVLEKLGYKGR